MDDNNINDKRTAKEFNGISFSNYKKTLVKKELLNSLDNGKIEHSCNWAVELICAGHYFDLWEIILTYTSKNIHLGNPKLSIYLDMRFQNFKTIVNNGYIDNELSMRNNPKIRQLFAEVVCILCLSNKKHRLESIKIKKQEEFDITCMTSKLKAPSVTYANSIYLKEDPKELFIAINEFAYNISKDSLQCVNACYWIEWVMEFENICKKRKEKCMCERRVFAPVQEKFQMDIIWLIWNAIIHETGKRNNKMLSKIIESLLNIFSIRYTHGVKKRRRYIMYNAVLLLTEKVNYHIDIIENQSQINNITNKINIIYKQVKQNEVKPNTDYLFNGIGKSNLEKTIEKLDKMNQMNLLTPRQ